MPVDVVREGLDSVINGLSDNGYEQSFAFYRLWFDIQHTYPKIQDRGQIFDAIWDYNARDTSAVAPEEGKLFHPTSHLFLRFASDAESDSVLGSHSNSLQTFLCLKTLRGFFWNNMASVPYKDRKEQRSWEINHHWLIIHSNFIALWANSGFVEETAIRNHILQSLISHPKMYDHQADALIVLFKLAGATLEAYAEPSVVDRCFELLKNHYPRGTVKGNLAQEVLQLRECGWEGLPSPPVFDTRKLTLSGAGGGDPSSTPVATSFGLPDTDFEPKITRPSSPPASVIVPGTETVPNPPTAQSPSISIASLSDLTIGDTSDDELPVDSTTITPHDTFYLEDGGVEVLCGKTLFRVHPSVLSFHSSALRQMFTQANLATAESPNGCPRIFSPDLAPDFATLLKVVYLPEFPERNNVPDFNTFSSLLRITAKYEMPTVQSRLLEAVQNAYPETFEGVTPTKSFGEKVFGGLTPHPNEVLNLFIQQKLTSALPMAYYMAARRGLNSLMGRHLPRSATLTPDILQSAISGLMELREVERDEMYRLIFGSKTPQPCSESSCLSHGRPGPASPEAYQKIFDHIVGSPQLGTKVLQVLEFNRGEGSNTVRVFPEFCRGCVGRWEVGHANLRRKVWAMLPSVFGLKD